MGKTLIEFPHLLKEWHPTRNGKVNPEEISSGSNKKFWWKCDAADDHEWEARPNDRSNKESGCPFCIKGGGRKICLSNCLSTTHPEIAKEWHLTKNGLATPFNIGYGSGKRYWWKCGMADDHEWEATPNNRTAGESGCPFCNRGKGHKICLSNCLATTDPKIAKEWHPIKNGLLTPYEVGIGSDVKFWWKCSVADDHEWEASPNSRTKCGCPYCSGRKVGKSNCLATLCPILANEWHPTKNKLTPFEVVCGSNKKVWWKGECEHEWESTVNRRTASQIYKTRGCPYCCGLKVNNTNSLATILPEIAKQWHSTKNEHLTPNDYTFCSGKKVWWQCKKGHEWQSTVANRKFGYSCPICKESKGEERIRQFLVSNNLPFKCQTCFETCKHKRKLPFDFSVQNNDGKTVFVIEYNGRHHYEPVKFAGAKWSNDKANEILEEVMAKDKIKKQWCKENKVPLLVIPYWKFDNIKNKIVEFMNHLQCHRMGHQEV